MILKKDDGDKEHIAIYINPSASLPPNQFINNVMVIAFIDNKILMIQDQDDKDLKFPEFAFDHNESIEKTLRREVYNQTGALIRDSSLLGTLTFVSKIRRYNCYIPLYIGNIMTIENTALMPKTLHRKVLDIEESFRELKAGYWSKIKAYLFYHAYKLSQAMNKQNGGKYHG